MSRLVTKGTTDVSIEITILDDTDGTPETGVLFNTAGMDLKYRREGEAAVSITEATLAALTTAHTDGGFLEIGNGEYRLDLPDAACASGADSVVVYGTVTGMVVVPVKIQLTDFDLMATLNDPTSAAIADAVWDEAKAGHTAAGSFGEEVQAHALSSEVTALNDLSAADVNAEVDTALADYDGPTKAEMDSGFAALNDPTAGDIADAVWDEPMAAHVTAGTFSVEVQSHATSAEIIALNDLSAADVNAEVDTALADYDGPTKAEMDSGFAGLNDPTAATIADAVWDEAKAGHVAAGSFGEEVQSHALSTEISALNDISAADVRIEMDSNSTQLQDILADTEITIPSLIAGLNDPSSADIADAVWDEGTVGHVTGGTFGAQCVTILNEVLIDTNELQTDDVPGLIAALNDPTAAAIADAVWDEAKAGHVGAGTFGEEVQAHALSTEIAALNDLSAADVNAEVDTAISDAALATAAALATVDANVDLILADTGTDGVALSATTINAIADGLLDRADGVEPASRGTEITVREALRVTVSALAGKVSDADSSPILFRDLNDSRNVITATVDGSGNRTAVVLNTT